jgi:hypothetical protein
MLLEYLRPKSHGTSVPYASSRASLLRKAAISRARWAHAIFTQAETWEELRANVLEAVSLHLRITPRIPASCNSTT